MDFNKDAVFLDHAKPAFTINSKSATSDIRYLSKNKLSDVILLTNEDDTSLTSQMISNWNMVLSENNVIEVEKGKIKDLYCCYLITINP